MSADFDDDRAWAFEADRDERESLLQEEAEDRERPTKTIWEADGIDEPVLICMPPTD